MGTLLHDIRYGVRMLARNPGFTAMAVLSLALGIGANTSIFSLINEAILRPLPVEEPERLVTLFTDRESGLHNDFSYPDYADYRDRNEVLSGFIAYDQAPINLSGGGQTERIWGQIVTGNYFSVLGVDAAIGRTFLPEEDRVPGASPVAVISHGLWQRQFGGDAGVVGQAVTLNGHRFTVVGIAPAGFTGAVRGFLPDIWVPIMMHEQIRPPQGFLQGRNILEERGARWLKVMGRLRPGLDLAEARAAMRTLAEQLAGEYPQFTEAQLVLLPGGRGHAQFVTDFSLPLTILMAAAGLVLLIACANVANLLVARASVRRREIAIRLALGASRRRLLRQLLTESMLLAVIGGGAGLLLAVWMTELLLLFTPPSNFMPVALEGSLDLRVLTFALLLSLSTGLVFGLAPALQASSPDVVPALKDETNALRKGPGRWTLRNLLVISQVALSLVVLVGAALFIRSLQNLRAIESGFVPDNVLVMSLDLALNGYTEPRGREFYRELIGRVERLPGVAAVSLASVVRLSGGGTRRSITIDGYTPQPGEGLEIDFNVVTPKYLETMGVPLLHGRDFDAQDRAGAPKVVIINEVMARKFFPGQDPLGKRIRWPTPPDAPEEAPLEIIGVAKSGKYRTLTEDDRPSMYLPFPQNYRPNMALHVRTAGDPRAAIAALRREVQLLDETLPVFGIRTLTEQVNSALYTPRAAAILLSVFGLLALLLASVGIYGVIAYSVTQRTREIGVRMALGAQAGDVLRLVLRQGLALVLAGVAAGLAGALALTRLASSLLYGVSATDPAVFAAASLLLALVALVACYVPARRATKVDPMVALRYE